MGGSGREYKVVTAEVAGRTFYTAAIFDAEGNEQWHGRAEDTLAAACAAMCAMDGYLTECGA